MLIEDFRYWREAGDFIERLMRVYPEDNRQVAYYLFLYDELFNLYAAKMRRKNNAYIGDENIEDVLLSLEQIKAKIDGLGYSI